VRPVGSELAEGVYFAGCSLELPDEFVEGFRRLHGSEPTAAFVAHYADAATILLTAVAKVAKPRPDGSLTIDPAALRLAVRSAALSDGLSGHIAFDGNGDRVSNASAVEERALDLGLAACQVKRGRLSVVFPQR
jgi:ABC-type branched-subunit amino acid transport system substrate-binding protein